MSYTLDQLIENGGGYIHQDTLEQARDEVDAEITQLTARIAELTAEVDAVSAAIGTTRYMDPPDGGCPSLAEQVTRMKDELVDGQGQYEQLDRLMQANERNMQRRIDGLTAEVERYRSALSSVTDFSSDPAVIRIARNALREGES